MTHEIAVEVVPSDKLDEMTKAQAAAKPEVPDAAMDQKAEPQSSPSPQRQEQAQPNQQASHQDVQPTPPAQTAQPAEMAGFDPPPERISRTTSLKRHRLCLRANKRMQRSLDDPKYQIIFPDTAISQGKGTGYLRNTDILEFVASEGYFRNATVGGPIPRRRCPGALARRRAKLRFPSIRSPPGSHRHVVGAMIVTQHQSTPT